MFGLVLNALRARRAQSLTVFALTVLAGLGAAAGPWFLAWGRDAVAAANVSSATGVERVVVARGVARYAPGDPSPMEALRDRVSGNLDIPGSELVVGANLFSSMRAAADPDAPIAGLYLNARDGVCAHLTLDGRCPTGPGEVVISRATAESLRLGAGDSVRFEGFRLKSPVTLTIAGTYQVGDPLGTYWAGTDLLARANAGGSIDEPAFVSAETLLGAGPDGLEMDFHVVLPEHAFRDPDVDLVGTLNRIAADVRQANFDVTTSATDLIGRIARERLLVTLGVSVGVAQLVLICWVGLFLAVRQTAEERRADIGLLKLRGTPPWRIWALTAQQSALPMIAGTVVGWGLGFVAAGALAVSPLAPARTDGIDPATSLWISAAAAAAACLGALATVVAAEWGALGAPVLTLLRRVPGAHRGWRADVVELALVVVAVAGVYQGHAELTDGGGPSALALLAPALLGLAVALVVARMLPALAARSGTVALRAGRPGLALAALQLARRPGTNRIFAVVAVAVTMMTTATLFWHTATQAWRQRAVQELGADRILVVQAAGAAHLLAAVRTVDPDGRYAMAVARTDGVRPENRIVAVDSTRLAQVLRLPDGAGTAAALAGGLHPAAPAPPSVVDGALTLDISGPDGLHLDESLDLRLHLSTVDGVPRQIDFAALAPGRRTLEAAVSGCVPECRLVSIELVAPVLINRSRPAAVEIHGLRQPDRDVLPASLLGDVTRWRPQLGGIGIGPVVNARNGQLTLSLFTGPRPPGQRVDARVLPIAAPAPLPIVLAGPRPEPRKAGDERINVLGGTGVPYHVVGTAPALPRVGGSGALVDLEYALRSNDGPAESATLEVWLTPDAPDPVVAALADHGVRVLAAHTVGERVADLARHGPGLALRFQYFTAAIILLLAAGTVVVAATVERRARVAELAALRAQGLADREVTRAAYAGTGVLVGAALLTGVMAAFLAEVAVISALPAFADGWALLPAPSGPPVLPLVVAATTVLAVIGVAALAGSARLVAGVSAQQADRHRESLP
jgi:hypothetical protein